MLEAVKVLNEALAADPIAVNALMRMMVPVNELLAAHPSIQVGKGSDMGGEFDDAYYMRPLGLINGLFGVNDDGWGYIFAETDDKGNIVRFGLIRQ